MKSKHIDRLVQLLLFAAVSCALTPVMYFFFSGTLRGWIWLMPLLICLLLYAGFGMQLAYGRRFGYRHSLNGVNLSIGDSGFRTSMAALPIAAALLFSALTVFLYSEIYYHTTIVSTDLYRIDSPFPMMAAVGTFICLLTGIVLWFYPLEKIVNIRLVVPLGACSAALIIAIMISGTVFSVLSSICFFVLFVCVILLLNQSYIARSYRGSVVSVMTPEARLYNMRLMLYMIGAVAAAGALIYVILSGGATLGLMILFTTLYQLLNQSEYSEEVQYHDPDLAAGEFRKSVFRGSPAAEFVFYIFLVILVLFIIFVVFRRLREIAAGIGAWINEVISFWVIAKSFWVPTEIEILNYTDEETKLQDAAIRDYHAMAERAQTYEDFLARLNALPTMDEKMSFAYSMMLRACRKAGIQLKTSDTPRQACEKLRRFDIADSEELTAAFELVKYAEQDLGERTAEAIQAMCAVVKKYMF